MTQAQAETAQRPGASTVGPDTPDGTLLTYPQLRGVSLMFVLMGIMMHTIDSTITNVALPHMQGALSASLDQVSWVITGYIVASAVATPPVAWLSTRFGIRKIILISVGSFTFASVLCGLAVSLQEMVIFRVLQGLSGAALIPVGQVIVLSSFRRKDYGKAMGLFGLGVMVGPILGPTLGGYITEVSSWRWVFFVNVPFGIAAMIGIWVFVKDVPPGKAPRFDTIGFASLVTALVSFQVLMDRGHGEDWFTSWEIIGWAALSLTALYIFAVRIITAREPFFDRRLFKDKHFAIGNIVFFFVGGNMVATMIMVPSLMQSLLGYPVQAAGLLLAPRGLGMMLAMVLTPRLAAHMDPRIAITIGMILTSYASWDQAQIGIYFSAWDFARTGFVHGMGLGMVFVLIGTISFNHLPDDIRLQASTFFNMVRNIGQSFCAAVAVSALARNIQVNASELGEAVTLHSQSLEFAASRFAGALPGDVALSLLQAGINRQAAFIAYINNFYALAILTLLFAGLVWLVPRPPELNDETA